MKRTLTSLFVTLVLAAASQAQIVGFDDLPHATASLAVDSGYSGLNWSNFYYKDGSYTGGSLNLNTGYFAGIVSPDSIAYNGFGAPASILAIGDATFSVQSAFLTGAWNDDLQIQLQGFLDGTLVSGYDFTVAVGATAPTKVFIGFENIDELRFTSWGGTAHAGYNGGGAHFALDDLVVGAGQAVPEPSTYGLFGAVALLGVAVWRRQAARR